MAGLGIFERAVNVCSPIVWRHLLYFIDGCLFRLIIECIDGSDGVVLIAKADNAETTVFRQRTNEESQGQSQERATFMLEPRDESLFRKKKVIEILKTF